MGSEDIKLQLPDEAKRFETIDGAFKEMLREAREEPGVIVACTWEGREELLNNFFLEIETCEKALNEYLEVEANVFQNIFLSSFNHFSSLLFV